MVLETLKYIKEIWIHKKAAEAEGAPLFHGQCYTHPGSLCPLLANLASITQKKDQTAIQLTLIITAQKVIEIRNKNIV